MGQVFISKKNSVQQECWYDFQNRHVNLFKYDWQTSLEIDNIWSSLTLFFASVPEIK